MWWNDEIKTAVMRKEATWKGELAASDDVQCGWELLNGVKRR